MRNAELGMRTAAEFGLIGHLRRRRAPIRIPRSAIRNQSSAFSLVEMLVVIGIIVIILSVVLTVGQGAMNDAKVKVNRLMLEQLNTAISVYSQNNPFASIKAVKNRYGPYPPDDLMAFTLLPTHGKSGTNIGIPDLMPGGVGQFVKANAAGPIHDDYNSGNTDPNYVENGANKALVWSLRSLPASREIYDSISDRFKETVPTDEEFFDVNGNGSFDPLTDIEVQYLVDGWDHPIEYFAARVLTEGSDFISATSHAWVSRRLVQSNKNLPVLVSYGLDGDVQFEAGETFEQEYEGVNLGEPLFTSQLHQDNIYLDDALKDRIMSFKKN